MRPLPIWLSTLALCASIALHLAASSAKAQTVIRPWFMLVVDNSGSMNNSTGTGTNSCGYSRTRINDVGCVIRNATDGIGDATFGLATFNFSCRTATPHYPNGVSSCGSGTCPSASSRPTPSTFPSLPFPSFYGCSNGGRLLVPMEEGRRYELRSWVDGVWSSCTTVPAVGSTGGNELCMVPTSTNGALIGYTPNAAALRVTHQYLSNNLPGTPSPYVNVDGTGMPDRYAACRPLNIIALTDGNETCAGSFGASLNAANLGCLQVDLNENGIFEDPIPATDPNPLVRGLYERNRDLNGDGDCYDAGEQRAFRVRTYSVQFEGTVGTDCGCDTQIENVGLYGGTPSHTVGCSTTACSGLSGGRRYGYYARSEEEFAAVLSQIVADSALVETCNGMDDDCDGEIDETFSLGGSCTEGTGVCARTGTRVCSTDGLGTVCSVTAGAPSPESDATACGNGADDDCDGNVDCADDDCVTLPVCMSSCVPGVEVCNGADDDCDGRVDEGDLVRPCGVAVGVCTPGVETCVEQSAPGSGSPMYSGCTAMPGGAETCNGLDDDCNGAIDDGLPPGGPCGEGMGFCTLGTERCVGGRIVCAGGVPGRRERCNCMDDDCDGEIDEETDGALCGAGSECIGAPACQCAALCMTDEFGTDRCATGRFPDRSTGTCICLLPPCTAAGCASQTVERGGEVVCAPDRTDVGPCVCRGTGCEPACDGVVCGPGAICDPFDPAGRCIEDSCRTQGCPEGEVCNQDTGACEADPCAGVTCDPGQICRDGTCVTDPCAGVTCDPGERCVNGTCEVIPLPDAGSMDAGGNDRVLASGGCSCRVPATPSRAPLGLLLALAALLAVRRRSRRKASSLFAVAALVLGGCAVDPFCLDCNPPPDGGPGDSGGPFDGGAPEDAPAGCVPGATELCNGRDDNCDGRIDEGIDTSTSLSHCGGCNQPCEPLNAFGRCDDGVCSVDVCEPGFVDTQPALGCEYACAVLTPDIDAICDGLDDDCDEQIDEDVNLAIDPANCGRCGEVCFFPNAASSCVDRTCVQGDCAPGFYDRDPAVPGCEYPCLGAPGTPEACNGLDEDCDGLIDEDVTPPSGLCRTLGECASASAMCMGVLGFRCTYGAGVEVDPATGQPVARETRCDNLDGNCNGAVDEAFATLGDVCNRGTSGACRTTGRLACTGDGTGVECNAPDPPPPGTEECNGVDDDCDGAIDEPRSAPGASPSFVTTAWTEVAANTWMMRYEASRPDASMTEQGALSGRACSRAGVLPWTSLRQADAAAACSAIGARLCTEAELTSACRGTASCTYAWQTPGCTAYSLDACNTADRTEPDSVLVTGALAECRAITSGGDVFDLSGNVKEYAASRASGAIPVRGGSYNQSGFGAACSFDWQVVGPSFRFENVGFRCCFTGGTPP